MAKKYKHFIYSLPRGCKINATKTKRRACPDCGNNDNYDIIQLHGNYVCCRKCKVEYEVGEDCFDDLD